MKTVSANPPSGNSDAPSEATQQNMLTLVATSDQHCRTVVDRVGLDLFGEVLRPVAAAAYAYVKRYGKAPGLSHLKDELESILTPKRNDDKAKKKAELVSIVLEQIESLAADSFNPDYVVTQIDTFIHLQELKKGVVALFEASEHGDLDTAKNVTQRLLQQIEAHGSRQPEVDLRTFDQISMDPVDWAWDGWIARGKLHGFAGAPGTGKTTISMSFSATTTVRNARWPDNTRNLQALDVLIWSGEDDAEDTLKPRLAAMNADMSKVHIVHSIRDSGGVRPFDPAHDMALLERAAAKIGRPIGLMILDSVVSAVPGDSHKNAETRRGLQPVVDFARRARCAVLGISHFTKGTKGQDPNERVTGSLAFGALPRIVMAAATLKLPEDPNRERFLVRTKSNLGPVDGAFCYSLKHERLASRPDIIASRVCWAGMMDGNARDLLETAEQGKPKPSEWLAELLADGPMLAGAVFTAASDQGYSEKQAQNAADYLKVQREKLGMGQGWQWILPDPSQTQSNKD